MGESKKLIFPVAFWHLCPSYTAISIKCVPWGANNNKQLLVNALCQHVPFAPLTFLCTQPTKHSQHQRSIRPDLTRGGGGGAFVCVFVFLTFFFFSFATEDRIREGIGLMLIIAPAITAKSFGRCTPAKLLTVLISSDCLVLLGRKSLPHYCCFCSIYSVILQFPLKRY